MEDKQFIPALKYHWLTGLYDGVVNLSMPEKKFKEALLSQATIANSHKVLDFGCGTATLSIMGKQTHPKVDFYGVDVDKIVLEIARKKIQSKNLSIPLYPYNGITLPFQNANFDRVLSSLVFHHLTPAQKIAAFKEIYRVLKPNGELHVADWGKSQNTVMRGAFLMIQLLDGFSTTTSHVKGLLPSFIAKANFKSIEEVKHFNTVFGTLTLVKAKK